jgi:hypothetical protein
MEWYIFLIFMQSLETCFNQLICPNQIIAGY